jgi:TonB family protein
LAISTSLLNKEINNIPVDIDDSSRGKNIPAKGFNKEFFFLVSFVASFLLIGLILLINALSPETLANISSILERIPFIELKISDEIVKQLKFPNPITNTIFLGNIIFIGYVLYDSFTVKKDIAALVKVRREDGSFFYTYRNTKAHFTESSSLSFAIHCVILFFIILSLLLSWQSKPKVKITNIEFIPTQIVSKKAPPKDTKRKAAKQSIDQGKHDPAKKVTPATAAGKPQQPKPQTKASPTPKAATQPSLPKIAPKPKTAPPASAPKASTPKAAPAPKAAPRPSPKPSPKPLVSSSGEVKSTEDLRTGGALPKLMDYKSDGAVSTVGGSGTGSVPAPKEGGSGVGAQIISQLGSIPRAPDSLGQSGTRGSYGTEGNPGQNPYGNRPPSVAAQADVNFGPYMSALQRKIKRAWRPPRGSESNRIVVTFVVLKDGRLSDLRIVVSSPDPEANMAALKAVSEASPFDPLPAGSGDTVDIEFTFDYNVFQKQRY